LKIFLFLPAIIGWLVHAPIYLPLKSFALKKLGRTVHVDSVLTALLVFTYPIYLLLIVLLLLLLTKCWWFLLLFVILPFTVWSYMQLKGQLDQ
jgi:apolipoprotein N-acyltransferase